MTGDRGGPDGPPPDGTRSGGAGMARADLVTALALFALGVAAFAGGLGMDRLEVRRIHPLSVPGLVPTALGAALAFTSLLLFVGAVRAGGLAGWGVAASPADRRARRVAAGRLALCLALTLAYPLLLVGRMPFWLATAIFVAAFIVLFEARPRPLAGHLRAAAIAMVQGVATGLVVAVAFSEVFLVRLP